MNIKELVCLTVLCDSCAFNIFGEYINFDFESANVEGFSSTIVKPVPISDALPGWSAYYGGNPTSYVWYDASSLGSSLVSLFDNKTVYPPVSSIDGEYSASLDVRTSPVAIAQTGTIPSGSLSVVFLVRNIREGSLVITFDGNVLPYVKTWSEPTFDVCNADISPYVGKTGELKFTENSGCNVIDDIQFSSEPFTVPEPGAISLLVMGTVALAGRFMRHKRVC